MSNLIFDYYPKSFDQWYSRYLDSFEALPPPKRAKAQVARVSILPVPPPREEEIDTRPELILGQEVYHLWTGNKGRIIVIDTFANDWEPTLYTVELYERIGGPITTVRCRREELDVSNPYEGIVPTIQQVYTTTGTAWMSFNGPSYLTNPVVFWHNGIVGTPDRSASPMRGPLTGNPFHSEVAPLP